MKIILYLILAIVQLVAAVLGFFIMLIGLNGFSERQATPSVIFYIVISVVTVLGNGGLSLLLARLLSAKTRVGRGGAFAISGMVVMILGVLVLICGLFAAFLLAETIRGMR